MIISVCNICHANNQDSHEDMAINGEAVEEDGGKGEDDCDYADDVDGEEELRGDEGRRVYRLWRFRCSRFSELSS